MHILISARVSTIMNKAFTHALCAATRNLTDFQSIVSVVLQNKCQENKPNFTTIDKGRVNM